MTNHFEWGKRPKGAAASTRSQVAGPESLEHVGKTLKTEASLASIFGRVAAPCHPAQPHPGVKMSSALPAQCVDPHSVGMSPERLQLLDATLQQLVFEGQLPFARLKVLRYGKLVHDITVNSSLGEQTEESIYRYYSMTKIVTSVAVLICVERGLLALDDPVEKYVPEMAGARVVVGGSAASGDLQTESASMPTVRQCLTHTAGLGYGGLRGKTPQTSGLGFGWDNDEVDEACIAAGCGADMLGGGMAEWGSLAELAATLAAQPLRHHPGTRYDYGMGHILAGRCIEVAMGRTLTEVMQSEIFDPLDMTDAGWGVHDADPRVLPMYRYGTFEFPDPERPWMNRLGQLEPHTNDDPRIHDHCKSEEICAAATCYMPDAQMTGTAADWEKFHVALARAGSGSNGHQLLSPASVTLLMANSLPGGVTCGEIAAPSGEGITPLAGFGLGGYSTVPTPGGPTLMSAGSYGWDGAAGTKAMWDTTTGLGFIFYTQLEFRATPECADFTGAITAQIYGALQPQKIVVSSARL